MKRACVGLLVGLSLVGCERAEKSSSSASSVVGTKPAVTWKGLGLSTPESVLHDETADVYLVSNIEGKPAEADGKAFIARLRPDGGVEVLRWIDGGKNGATLNAPKGMAIVGDRLFVADLDTVRIFDRKTGAPAGEVKIAGATFLNDVAAGADGRVLVSDTGLGSGSDAVYAIDAKARTVTPLAKSKELGGPNGIAVQGDKTWVVSLGSGELYALDAGGKRTDVQKLPKGSLDGVVVLGADLLVSSWDASAVYRGRPGGEFKVVVAEVKSPADIGYDRKRGRLLVPLFGDDEVRAYDLK